MRRIQPAFSVLLAPTLLSSICVGDVFTDYATWSVVPGFKVLGTADFSVFEGSLDQSMPAMGMVGGETWQLSAVGGLTFHAGAVRTTSAVAMFGNFSSGVQGIGFQFSGSGSIVIDIGNGSHERAARPEPQFWGFSLNKPISGITIYRYGDLSISNLTLMSVAPPVPAPGAAILLGAVGITTRRRRLAVTVRVERSRCASFRHEGSVACGRRRC